MLFTQEQETTQRESLGQAEAKIISRKGVWHFVNSFDFTKAKENKELLWEIGLTYGLTDSLGIEFFVPILLKNTINGNSSRGISDCVSNIQWTFFDQKENIASIQGGIKFPTGNTSKNPRTGTGTYDATIEFLAIHSSEKWFASLDIDTRITTQRKGKKPGNIFAYEILFGKIFHLNHNPNSTIYFNLDLFGIYHQPDKNNTIIDEDSGGTVIFFGPLVSYSYKNFLVEFSFQVPIAQNLFGNQPCIDFATFFSCTLRF